MEDLSTIHIDGSYGEGGGQIIRTSLSLSAITGKPVHIKNVRANRSKPGLQPQHLMAVNAMARVCSAEVKGAEIGAREFTFHPGTKPYPNVYRFEIQTAGASTLVMQTVLIPLALSNNRSTVTVTGGTHVPHAPAAQYVEHVFIYCLKQHGLQAEFAMHAAGYYPRGGGEIEAVIDASQLKPLVCENRGRLQSLKAYIITTDLPDHVTKRGIHSAEHYLKGYKKPEVIAINAVSRGQGAAFVLIAECENSIAGFSSIGERGKPMENVVESACKEFAQWYKTEMAFDEHLADQLVLPMSLVPSQSKWTTSKVTEHLRTVTWLVPQFIDAEVSLVENSDGTGIIYMRGMNVNANS